MRNGRKTLKALNIDAKVNEEKMKQHNNDASIRALGIYISPALFWDRQFQEVKLKMEESVGKLSNTAMTAPLTHAHVNAYFMSKVHFGCGIFDITEGQEQELKSMCEMPSVWKLNLGSNFPRKLLCGRVTATGIGIMAPRTATEALTIKLCMSHQRMKSENGKLMQMIENNQMIESGAGSIESQINNKACLGKKLWTENVVKMLNERNATIRNGNDTTMTKSKTAMEKEKECA